MGIVINFWTFLVIFLMYCVLNYCARLCLLHWNIYGLCAEVLDLRPVYCLYSCLDILINFWYHMLTRFSGLKFRWRLCWLELFYAFYLLHHSSGNWGILLSWYFACNIFSTATVRLSFYIINQVCASNCLICLKLCTSAPPVRDFMGHILSTVYTGHANAQVIACSSNCHTDCWTCSF